MRNKCLILCTILLVWACEDRNIWEQQVSVDNCVWSKYDTLSYNIPAPDTLGYYDILLNIRNRTDYPFSNIYLFVTAEAPNGAYSIDTINFVLAEENGKWIGKGNSQYRDNRFLYRSKIRFPVQGDYLIKVRQGMRRDSLNGIANIGLELQHSQIN